MVLKIDHGEKIPAWEVERMVWIRGYLSSAVNLCKKSASAGNDKNFGVETLSKFYITQVAVALRRIGNQT
jgi:hypothetical protein